MDINWYSDLMLAGCSKIYHRAVNFGLGDMNTWVTVAATVTVILITVLRFWYKQIKVPIVIRVPELDRRNSAKFRKRDKVEFLARKVLRKGKNAATKLQRQASAIKEGVSVPEYSRSGRRLRKRERMYILAKRMFRVKQEPPKLLKKELPLSMLEARLPEEQEPNLPEEVLYLLQSVKVFGHFEKGVFLQLCRHMEILKVENQKYLFQVGDSDEYIYVIQEGQVNLYIAEDGVEVKLSEFTTGESLHSLLSILDVLTGHTAPYKTVFARAMKDSTVIRLPVEAFNKAFENRIDSLIQVVQVVMTRMQRVTFLALHNYLGLSQELLSSAKSLTGSEILSIHSLSLSKESLSSLPSQDSGEIPENSDVAAGDVTDAAALATSVSGILKTKSEPEKAKKLRFGEFDTVVDDNDNVFHRQSSLLAKEMNNVKLTEIVRQAAVSKDNDAIEDQDMSDIPHNFTKHRSSVMTLPNMTHNELTFGIDKNRLRSQESFADNSKISELNEPEILDLVIQDMLQLFEIEDKEMLRENVSLLKVPRQCDLIQEGDQDVSLYFVVTGALRVYQSVLCMDGSNETQDVVLFHAVAGNLTGQLSVLTGEPSFFSVQSTKNSVVARLSRKAFYTMMQHYPRMVLSTAHTVVQRVSKFTRQIDFALDWTRVEAGKALYKQSTLSDCMYIVLNGRLRSVHEKAGGKKELVSEYGRGEVVGMMEALRGTKRGVSMHAVRDTELAKIPEGLLKHIRRHHPTIVSHLMSLMSDKLIDTMMSSKTSYHNHPGELLAHKHQMAEETKFAYGNVSNHLANLSTVAVMPVNRDVPLDKVCLELEHALSGISDQIVHLNSDIIKKRLGKNAFDLSQEYRLTGWLAQQEDLHRIVLYQTDDRMSDWTQRCIRQSDAILIVALGDGEPKVGELEQELENYSVRALKVLVLLHRPDVSQPTRTVEWLNMRGWLTQHLHVKASKRLFARTRKSKLAEYREKLSNREVNRFSDFSRLARFLTGKSIALVLGGGGARGIAQLGMIKAIREARIPIDQVGGTSFGAFFGALWACHRDLTIVRSKMVVFCAQISSVLGQVFDLTYPITSMFSGYAFNRTIHTILKDTQIEDMWLPYFVVTTDITNPKMRVHTDGSLWRYVRGSMTLSGYLPPICDPKDGHLLMDGGYINNLPGDVARSRGACRVIAIDVGAATETDFTNYGDHLSGWWLLWKKWTGRWTGQIRIPNMNEIQQRLSYISCHYLMDLVIKSDYCTYLRPPIVQYGTLEFNKWQEIVDVGYNYGKNVCSEQWGAGFWKDLCELGSDDLDHGHESLNSQSTHLLDYRRRTSIAHLKGNTSFTDLSELLRKRSSEVCIPEFSDLELEVGYVSSPEVNSHSLMHAESQISETDEIVSDGDAATRYHHSLDEVPSSEDEVSDNAL